MGLASIAHLYVYAYKSSAHLSNSQTIKMNQNLTTVTLIQVNVQVAQSDFGHAQPITNVSRTTLLQTANTFVLDEKGKNSEVANLILGTVSTCSFITQDLASKLQLKSLGDVYSYCYFGFRNAQKKREWSQKG